MKLFAPAAACLLMIASCQNRNERSGSPEGYNESADSTGASNYGATDTIGGVAPKLVKTAGLTIQVGDVSAGSQALGELARSYGGSLTHLHLEASETARRELPRGSDSVLVLHALAPSASITVRIPADKLEEFLFDVSRKSSFVHASDFDVDDKTLDYVEAQWRSTARERFLASPRTSAKVTGTAAGLDIRDEVIDQRVAQARINTNVRYSAVHLELSQPPVLHREVIVNTGLDHYQSSFGTRLGESLRGGWGLFEAAVVAGAWLWIFILIALLAWVSWRFWLRKTATPAPSN